MERTTPTARPQDLITSVFAMYGRRPDAAIAVGDLIPLLAEVGVDEQAVRSALSRMRKRDVLRSVRLDGRAGYELNPDLADVFEEGDERIFGQRRAEPGDPWLLAAFSVPESERHLRHQIRRVLTRRGFGTVSAGLWIAPSVAGAHVQRELARADLAQHVELFVASYVDDSQLAGRIAQWWDLQALAELYREFLDDLQPVRRRWARTRVIDPQAAFGDYVPLVTRWRRLPFADPGLPEAYLPRKWPGLSAERTFLELHERLAGPARTHVTEVRAG